MRAVGDHFATRSFPHLRQSPRGIFDRLGLTGAKRSCDLQVCGACTLLVDGMPVSACCTLAYEANGKQVETVEGLARNGDLHPIQQAFIEQAAIQCGFCTSGMLLATKALLAETPHPSPAQIKHALAGNLCRCTGYGAIYRAVLKWKAGDMSPPSAASE